MPEVPPPEIPNSEMILDDTNIVMQEEEMETDKPSPEKYQLPPRSTRGKPPRRYDPEFEARRSKYPVNTESEGTLSKTAVAFRMALYSAEILDTVEKALKNEKWKKAMDEEISALNKNET